MTVTLETQLENYSLEQEIGRGDLTIVYQAHRKSDGAVVAVKIVPPQFTFDETFARRFNDAARQAIKLEHPNIVRTYEAGQEEDVLYIVREYIYARTLAQAIEEDGPFSAQRMLRVAEQVASALDYAHQRSIMHGDLSAKRVYIGDNDHVIVADFGQTQAMAGTSLVKQGFAVGVPETTAPERVHGQSPSRQSDLYSLGILCYQMLAADPPFKGTPTAVLHAQAYEQPRPVHLINSSISIALSETISRMLAKGSELRYITGAEFSRALGVATQGTAPMRAPAAATAQLKAVGLEQKPFWQRKWFWGSGVVSIIAILLLLGFAAVSLWNSQQSAVAPTAPSLGVGQAATATVESNESDSNRSLTETAVPNITRAAASAPTQTVTLQPATTPTQITFPTPGPPTVVADSPFTDLILAHGIGEDSTPEKIGVVFAPGSQPIYLFFNYENIEAGTSWTHRWTWGDTELDNYHDVWPESYSESGTAWVFYGPAGGYQAGPYQVTIEVEGRIVATATFVIQPGGL